MAWLLNFVASPSPDAAAPEAPSLPAFPILVRTLGQLLKFVVNSRLPVGPRREQHYVTESRRRHETCSAEYGVDLSLEEEDSQGFGITPT